MWKHIINWCETHVHGKSRHLRLTRPRLQYQCGTQWHQQQNFAQRSQPWRSPYMLALPWLVVLLRSAAVECVMATTCRCSCTPIANMQCLDQSTENVWTAKTTHADIKNRTKLLQTEFSCRKTWKGLQSHGTRFCKKDVEVKLKHYTG